MDRQVEKWKGRLEQIDRLAKKNRWQKLTTLYYKLPKSFFLRLFNMERLEIVHTFMNIPIELPFPESNDIFLFGAKVHDSEIRLTKFLLNYSSELKVFFDVGAHIGFYTTLVAQRFPKTKVFGFEPSTIFELLKNNTANYSNIEIEHLAVADRSGELEFYEFELGKKEYNSLILDKSKGLNYTSRKVEAVTLDEYTREHKIIPDLIKIDIEGGELQALKGMNELLKMAKVIIVLEIVKERESDIYYDLIELLDKYNYLAYQIAENGSLMRLKEMSELKCESENIVFKPKLLAV